MKHEDEEGQEQEGRSISDEIKEKRKRMNCEMKRRRRSGERPVSAAIDGAVTVDVRPAVQSPAMFPHHYPH